MKTLSATQAELRLRRKLAPIPLAKLQTYTDRKAGTLGTAFHLSDRPVQYDYGNLGTDRDFWPLLSPLDTHTSSIVHVPSPDAAVLVEKALTLRVSNSPYHGSRAITLLRAATGKLENAKLELAQILRPKATKPYPVDLRSLVGDEHTVFYRGEIARVGPITQESIELQARVSVPKVPWLYATDATKVSPRDLGRRLPMPFGKAKKIEAVSLEVGWSTTLAEQISSTRTGNTAFTDVSGLSGSGITVRVGREEVTATYVDAKTLNITARAQNSTTATLHGVGEVAIEMIATITYAVAGRPVSAIGDVCLRNPATGDLVRITGSFTRSASTTTAPGFSGTAIATVSFTAAQLRTILEEAFPDVDFSSGVQTINVTPSGRQIQTTTDASVDFQNFTSPGGSPVAVGTDGAGTRRYLRLWCPVDSIPDNSREVVRARLRVSGNAKSTSTNRSISCVIQDSDGDLPGFSSGQEVFFNSGANAEIFGQLSHGAWVVPPAGTLLSDFETNSPATAGQPEILFKLRNNNNTAPEPKSDEYAELTGDWGIQLEVLPTIGGDFVGALVGFNLELYADVDGVLAPSASYESGSGALMESGDDLARWWVEAIGGETVESTSFGEARTNLGAAVFAGDLRGCGNDWPTILARIGFETRSNLVAEEAIAGRRWKMLCAEADYGWPTTSVALTDWQGCVEAGRDLAELATRSRAFYAYDASLGTDESAYSSLLRCDDAVNDLHAGSIITDSQVDTAEDEIGEVDGPPLFFLLIRDAATAKQIFGYYVFERLRTDSPLFVLTGVPWWQAYDLEVGDFRNLTPPWGGSARKVRVIEIQKPFATELVELRAVTVT